MSSRDKLTLFSAKKVRSIADSSYVFKNVTRSQVTSSMPEDRSGIWRDDPQGVGLKSTQQVDLDYDDWTSHCFFNSAESKVNVTFDRIINHYPFDGNKTEMIQFMDQLTGYEKHVFDKFPKFIGSLSFDSDEGHYIVSQDKSGYLFPEISRNNLGERIIGSAFDKGGSTIEFQVRVPAGENLGNAVIFQKLNSLNNHGISIFASASASSDKSSFLTMALTSGSNSCVTASMEVPKGNFEHVAFVYDNNSTETLRIFLNGVQQPGPTNEDFDSLDFQSSNFYIGSGSSQALMIGTGSTRSPLSFEPTQTFSGSLDEFRVWNKPRTLQQIRDFRKRNVFASDDLAVYYRFNEPTGSYISKNVTLDMSGNGLHGQIANYTDTIRLDPGYTSSLPYERTADNPVLFPDYTDLQTLNANLLLSASRYDLNNPNLITKLLPPHYFLEGQAEEGFEDIDASLGEEYGYESDTVFPGGGGKIPTAQVLSSFLFIWASFFDELKVYLDAFSKLEAVEHVALDTIPAQFLESLANKYGFSLPNAFANTKPSQYVDGEALTLQEAVSVNNLKKVQELLWRRLLTELPSINREKGTISSVKSMMRSLGIEPDSVFRIREFGGRKSSRFGLRRKEVKKSLKYIDFSVGTPFLTSSNLRAMRHEPGEPFGGPTPPDVTYQGGTIFFTIGGTEPTDTLFTSASWAWEGHYKIPRKLSEGSMQSLFRIETSGSSVVQPAIALNLLAVSGSNVLNKPNLLKLAFSGSAKSSLLISGSIPDLFDGGFWYINVNHLAGPISSSFSVRASKTSGRTILASHEFSGSYPNDSYANNYLTNQVTDGVAAATASITAVEDDKDEVGGNNLVLSDSEGRTVTFVYDRVATSPSRTDATNYKIGVGSISSVAQHATALSAAIALAKTNGDLSITPSVSSDKVSLTQLAGPTGNTTISGTALSAGKVTVTQFSGGTTTGVWFAVGQSSNYRTDSSLGAARLLNGDQSSQNLDFTSFEGGLSNFRFWTKALTEREKNEHALNPYSVGVNNPLVNYNFIKTADGRIENRSSALGSSGSLPLGSWERLRFRSDMNQTLTKSDDLGVFELIDQSQNGIDVTGINFTADSSVLKRFFKSYSMFDPSFDIPTNINKVRIRSVQDAALAKELYALDQPVFSLDARERINDDRRFSIEASLAQALNEDIVNLFSDEEFLSDAIGRPENMFAINYPQLDRISDKYFSRLTRRINTKEFFEFFKWFDTNFSDLIERLMPRTTNFLGVNFVIESHLLERFKFEYKQADVHIDLNSRLAARTDPEFIGIIRTENQ